MKEIIIIIIICNPHCNHTRPIPLRFQSHYMGSKTVLHRLPVDEREVKHPVSWPRDDIHATWPALLLQPGGPQQHSTKRCCQSLSPFCFVFPALETLSASLVIPRIAELDIEHATDLKTHSSRSNLARRFSWAPLTPLSCCPVLVLNYLTATKTKFLRLGLKP